MFIFKILINMFVYIVNILYICKVFKKKGNLPYMLITY